MVVWKHYESLDGSSNSVRKKMCLYFLSIGCPLLALVLLCSFNVLSYRYNHSFIDNDILLRWDKEFGGFVNEYYFKFGGYPVFKKFVTNDSDSQTNLPNPPKPSAQVCSSVPDLEKFDCFPRGSITEDACTKRGCCYSATSPGTPTCFFPTNFRSYLYTSINRTEKNLTAEVKVNYNSPYPNISPNLLLRASFIRDDFLLIVICDSKQTCGYSEMFNKYASRDSALTDNIMYDIVVDPTSVGFQVIRKSTNVSIFSSQDIGGFFYSNQFIQISTKIPCKHLYGLGESRNDLPLNTNWTTRTLWNHDGVPRDEVNGYGSYPIYMCAEGSGNTHVAAFLNNYASDFILQPGGLTYRTTGGPFIMAFFLGPSPLEATQQASSGLQFHSILPPYWSLGFHLCRFGYKSVEDLELIWNKTRAAGIPYDTQWVDIDYMKNRSDFTLGDKFKNLGSFVDKLHKVGMHFVPIIDPGVSGSEPKGTYPPYDKGIELDIFVKDPKGKKPLIGKVWNPVSTVFPDFTHPKAGPYWIELLQSFHKIVPFDGIWLDMNEPSNFVNGSISGCPNNNLETPPYVPAVEGGVLNYLTLCMSAKHYLESHYAVHNVYGLFQLAITSFAVSQIRNKRPFVITRAGAPHIGDYGGHWTGDVISSWDDMGQSVKDIIHMSSLFGVNMVGADICGFNGNTTVNLCRRWHQLGAFYPFSRNHNSDENIDQDPVSLDIVASTKKALLLRYSLLPYLYTLFWQARNEGLPVVRPLFYLFPDDDVAYTINSQFMWGDGLLISPVLQEGVTYVKAYLGKSIWYDIYSSEKIISNSSQPLALAAPEDTIPVMIRGGTILIMQEPNVTTSLSRKNPFFLKVALNESDSASGMLYWDDGETIAGPFSTIYFGANKTTLMSFNDVSDYTFDLYINKIEIFALNMVNNVILNQKTTPFNFNSTSKVLTLQDLNLPIQKDFVVTWA